MSEFLDEDELIRLTGYSLPSKQITWLQENGWRHERTAAGRPVVGRVYARLRLAGVKPNASNATAEPWSLDLSKVS